MRSGHVTCIALLLLLCADAKSIAGVDKGHKSDRKTRVGLALPLWIPGYTGQFTLGDISVDGGTEGDGDGGGGWLGQFFDSHGGLEYFFLGRVGVNVDKWWFMADVFGGKLRQSVTFRLTDGTTVSASVRPMMARLLVGHRIKRWPLGSGGTSNVTLRGYGGIRYNEAKLEVTLLNERYPLTGTADWVDPLIGAQATFEVGDHWQFSAWTDVGGIVVGSKITWWAEIDAGYRFTSWFNLRLGWTFMHVEYEDTAASQDFRWDMWLTGPHLAMAFKI
jgi:hypothetical protein